MERTCLCEGGLEELQHPCAVVEVEDAPAYDHQQETIQVEQGSGDVSLHAEDGVFLDGDDQSEVHTPDDEVPRGTVPHTREEPHHEDVQCLVPTVAAHGDIHVVAEETAERDMPAPPKVGDGIAAVGVAEVFVEVEPQTAPQSDGHIRIA